MRLSLALDREKGLFHFHSSHLYIFFLVLFLLINVFYIFYYIFFSFHYYLSVIYYYYLLMNLLFIYLFMHHWESVNQSMCVSIYLHYIIKIYMYACMCIHHI